jgi:uncharacterized protein YjdB
MSLGDAFRDSTGVLHTTAPVPDPTGPWHREWPGRARLATTPPRLVVGRLTFLVTMELGDIHRLQKFGNFFPAPKWDSYCPICGKKHEMWHCQTGGRFHNFPIQRTVAMKMRIRWLTIYLAILAAVVLSACSGANTGEPEPELVGKAAKAVVPTVLLISPPAAFLQVTQKRQFTAIIPGLSPTILSSGVTWTVSDPTVASVNATGLVTALKPGNAVLTAASSGLQATSTLIVAPCLICGGLAGGSVIGGIVPLVFPKEVIAITPVSPSVPNGLKLPFVATLVSTVTLGNNSTLTIGKVNVTAAANWSSSNAAVAAFPPGSFGVATAASVGTTTITATFGLFTGTTILTVTPAVLTSIAVTPATDSISNGKTVNFTAIGTYSDKTTHDITTAVTWTSSSSAASVSNAAGSQGLATAGAVGTATIKATYLPTGIAGTATLTVTKVAAAVLTSIAVTPSTDSIPNGKTVNFTATGTYSDKTTHDITTAVTWTSSSSAASVSNAAGSQGLATAGAVGTATIKATYLPTGIAGTATLTVTQSTVDAGVDSGTVVDTGDAAGACLGFDMTGVPIINSTTVIGPPPAMTGATLTGGAIVPGDYVLTQATAYFPAAGSSASISPTRQIWRFGPTSAVSDLQEFTAVDAGTPLDEFVIGIDYTLNGNTQTYTDVCGVSGGGSGTEQFAASPTGLLLSIPLVTGNGTFVYTYVLR